MVVGVSYILWAVFSPFVLEIAVGAVGSECGLTLRGMGGPACSDGIALDQGWGRLGATIAWVRW